MPAAAAPTKRARGTKSRGTGRRNKKSSHDLFQLDESEVELDSLGLLFMKLIDV